jgi:hypothetical protein
MKEKVKVNILEIVTLRELKNSNNLESSKNIKILFRNKIRADWSQGTLVIIPCKIFSFPASYKIKDIQNYNISRCSVWV